MRALLTSSFLAFTLLAPHQIVTPQHSRPVQPQAQLTTAQPPRPAIYIPSEGG